MKKYYKSQEMLSDYRREQSYGDITLWQQDMGNFLLEGYNEGGTMVIYQIWENGQGFCIFTYGEHIKTFN